MTDPAAPRPRELIETDQRLMWNALTDDDMADAAMERLAGDVKPLLAALDAARVEREIDEAQQSTLLAGWQVEYDRANRAEDERDAAQADYRKLWDMTKGAKLPSGPSWPDTRESLLARIPEVQAILAERDAALARIESMLDAAVSTARRVPSPYADNVLNAVWHAALAVPVEPTEDEPLMTPHQPTGFILRCRNQNCRAEWGPVSTVGAHYTCSRCDGPSAVAFAEMPVEPTPEEQ